MAENLEDCTTQYKCDNDLSATYEENSTCVLLSKTAPRGADFGNLMQ